MAAAADWARAFARQARADFNAFTFLRDHPEEALPNCHALHFLQMACEKLCKAHLCAAGSNPADLQSSHAYIAKNLPAVVRGELENRRERKATINSVARFSKQLSRKIELLAPSVDDAGRRPDNSEYPWLDARGNIHVPADWSFFAEDLLTKPHSRLFIKMIAVALGRLA